MEIEIKTTLTEEQIRKACARYVLDNINGGISKDVEVTIVVDSQSLVTAECKIVDLPIDFGANVRGQGAGR